MSPEKFARPYAKAIFMVANKSGAFEPWSETLAFLSALSQQPAVVQLIKDPTLSQETIVDIFIAIGKDQLLPEAKNLLQQLGRFKRLGFLPQIAVLYEAYRQQAEKRVKVELISASAVDTAYQDRISQALSKQIAGKIELTCSVDENILGGAILRSGDMVIDGSVRGRLNKLANTLGTF